MYYSLEVTLPLNFQGSVLYRQHICKVKPANKHGKNKTAKTKKPPPVRDCWTQRDAFFILSGSEND